MMWSKLSIELLDESLAKRTSYPPIVFDYRRSLSQTQKQMIRRCIPERRGRGWARRVLWQDALSPSSSPAVLFMFPEAKEVWLGIYKNGLKKGLEVPYFKTANEMADYIATVMKLEGV